MTTTHSEPTVPIVPESAPFTPEQRAWLNGFFAGVFSRGAVNPAATVAAAPMAALVPLTILVGSQTGTSEKLAKRAAKEAGRRNFAATVMDLAAYTPTQLAGEKNVLVIASTYGDGEPADNAKTFHTALMADSAPKLAGLRFSVCGLGDTNYVRFCQCAKDFDSRLEALGGVRASARADCDLDYDAPFATWLDSALSALGAAPSPTQGPANEVDSESSAGYTRKKPVVANLITSRVLNLEGSSKEVRHVELSLEGTGVTYEPGDALGIFPHNSPELVGELLNVLGCDGEEAVPTPNGSTTSLRHALTAHYDLGRPSPELISRYAAPAAGGGAAVLTATQHVIDIVLSRPETRLVPTEFVRLLKALQPRLYSISSSPKAHPGQVHLTVGVVRYDAQGRERQGVCSTYLAERCEVGTGVQAFIHRNSAFRLPANPKAAVIMVGPGTGIAPFRSFLEERASAGSTGRNWIFFGDQHAATDFLYREELLAFQSSGVLSRLDLAFSRDQEEKVYVQERMKENASELFSWLENGAYLYVCGDASRMAKDVDKALHWVVETAGGKTSAQAAEYVQALKASRRYARDVY